MHRLNDDCLVAVLSELNPRGVVCASHVSRWTRDVALGTPALWSDLHWSQNITPSSPVTSSSRRQAFDSLLARSRATDLRLTLALHVTSRPCTSTNALSTPTIAAQAALADIAQLLVTLRDRIVGLTLDIQWPGAIPGTLPTLDLDLPRLQTLDTRKSSVRVVNAPLLRGVGFLENPSSLGSSPWGCGIGLPLEPVESVKVLEVPLRIPAVTASADTANEIRSGGCGTPPGGAGGFLNPVLRAFPRLEHLRVWESTHAEQDDGHWAPTKDTVQDEEDSLEHRHRLKSLDIRRSGLAARYPPVVLAALVQAKAPHAHVGVHGIQNANDFTGLLDSSSRVARVALAARAGGDLENLPFVLGPRMGTVFRLCVTLNDGRTRAMSTLNRRVAVNALEYVLARAPAATHLDVDGPMAWGVLGDALRESKAKSTSSLNCVNELTLRVRSVAELEKVRLMSATSVLPGVRNVTVRAPLGAPLVLDRHAVDYALERVGVTAPAVELHLASVRLM